jgi:hypothetical protein
MDLVSESIRQARLVSTIFYVTFLYPWQVWGHLSMGIGPSVNLLVEFSCWVAATTIFAIWRGDVVKDESD